MPPSFKEAQLASANHRQLAGPSPMRLLKCSHRLLFSSKNKKYSILL